jgi:hypothetical protein
VSKFKSPAYYKQKGHNSTEPVIEVLSQPVSDRECSYITRQAKGQEVPSKFAGEVLNVEMMAPHTYMLTSPPGKARRLPHAMLFHAAFQGHSGIETLATAVSVDDKDTIATYKALDFEDGYGTTQSGDRAGKTQELILIRTDNTAATRLAITALLHANIELLRLPPLQGEMPVSGAWADGGY